MTNIIDWVVICIFICLGLAFAMFVDFAKPPFNFRKREE